MTLVSPNRGYSLERLDGNVGSMGYWSGQFTRTAQTFGELRVAAQSAADLAGVGSSITAARADARELSAALVPDVAEAELLSGVLQRYADAFDSSAKRANDLIDDIETAHRVLEQLAGRADAAGKNALAQSYGDDTEASAAANQLARENVAERDAAKAALDELWREFEGFYSAWDEAYDAALSELAAGTGGTLTLAARDFLNDLLGAKDPAEVLRLWTEHPELRDELAKQHPDIIGNLDGIPYDVRAAANLKRLTALHGSELDEPLRSQIDAIWNEMKNGSPPAHLISFDPNGSEQVTAALAYGNLVSATNVNVLIPGMNSNVKGIGEWGMSARDLNAGVGPGSLTVVWFGYDSPSETEEPFMQRAEDGAAALRGFLLGLDALSPDAESAVIAHSYGSTTAALAIGSDPGGLGVDKLLTVGSAGFPSDPQVLENLRNGPEIFATLSPNDAWARIGRDTSWGGAHSVVPETMDGVTEFDSDGGIDAGGKDLAATPGHGAHGGGNGMPWQGDESDGYLVPGTESFYNIEQIIVTGAPGTEIDGPGSGSGFWDLPDWLPGDPYRF